MKVVYYLGMVFVWYEDMNYHFTSIDLFFVYESIMVCAPVVYSFLFGQMFEEYNYKFHSWSFIGYQNIIYYNISRKHSYAHKIKFGWSLGGRMPMAAFDLP